MSAPRQILTFSRWLARLWLTLWVSTIPLFHVHALDVQETPFLPQAFLTHTIFTPDLPGEYPPRTAIHQRGLPGHQRALASHFPQYSEIAFSLFVEEDDTKRKIGNLPIVNDEFSFLIPSLLESVDYEVSELASPPVLLLTNCIPSRAPPFMIS